jgi:predicted RNA-binding protein associated with RNAse of E/G family
MKQSITVIKRNPAGEEILRYTGVVLHQESDGITLEANFSRADMPFMHTILRQGDRFIETYYTERWYNIFEIHDRDDDRLKGWYCNIGKPAVIEAENGISYVDLALDLWVAPDGAQTVLDEDEFAALDLDTETRSRARAALEELQKRFSNNKEPGFF